MPIYIDLSSIKKKYKLDGRATAYLTSLVQKHMDKQIPMRTGNLRNQHTKTINTLTYEMPYAHAQYIGYTKGQVVHYTTPGTGPYWDKRMLNADKHKIEKELANYMTRGGY